MKHPYVFLGLAMAAMTAAMVVYRAEKIIPSAMAQPVVPKQLYRQVIVREDNIERVVVTPFCKMGLQFMTTTITTDGIIRNATTIQVFEPYPKGNHYPAQVMPCKENSPP